MPRKRSVSNIGSSKKSPPNLLKKSFVGYGTFLTNLKARIHASQTKAILSVNQELTLLYWQIGSDILQHQEKERMGSQGCRSFSKGSP